MEDSILESTKQILGILPEDDTFDLDIIFQINAAFATLAQLGVGPYSIESDAEKWSELDPALDPRQVAMIKPYVIFKTKMAFDPPQTSYHINAVEKQIEQYEWRINHFREVEPLP